MPVYEYLCCNKRFDVFVRNVSARDHINCNHCGLRAKRQVSSFSIGNQTYVADNLKNIEFATGIRGIETVGEADRALESTGTARVEPYYRPPKPPPPKEITMEEIAPYLDGMPLNNEPV